MNFLKEIYSYCFYLLYFSVEKHGEKKSEYYACFIFSFIGMLLFSIIIKYFMSIEIILIREEQRNLLFICLLSFAVIVMFFQWRILIATGKYMKIINHYNEKKKNRKREVLLHTRVFFMVFIIIMFVACFVPIVYVK